MADALGKRLGQQFIVEHRPGAGGTVGVAYAAKARPDGYTFVLVSAGSRSRISPTRSARFAAAPCALAVTSSRRLPQLPDVPTVIECGIPGYDVTSWNGMVAPAGTSSAVIVKLSAAALDALQDAEVADRFDKVGAVIAPQGPLDFEKFYLAEIARWGPIGKASGARID